MEYGSIEREIHVDASPEVVFEVVSSPEHITQWWARDAEFTPTPGAVGTLDCGHPGEAVPIRVVRAEHALGWDTFLPRLPEYAAGLVSRR